MLEAPKKKLTRGTVVFEGKVIDKDKHFLRLGAIPRPRVGDFEEPDSPPPVRQVPVPVHQNRNRDDSVEAMDVWYAAMAQPNGVTSSEFMPNRSLLRPYNFLL